jgi:hypothetical protein
MRLTLTEMRSDLTSLVPGFTPNQYDKAVNRAYYELARMYPWSKFDTEFKFVTKQAVETGGAIFSSGGTIIDAADNVSAAWGTSAGGTTLDFTGMFVKKQDEGAYYVITSNTSIALTITESYLGITTTAASSSGDSYAIFQHIYPINSSVDTVVHLMHDHYLDEMDDPTFERIDADLESEGEPSKWRNAGVNSAGVTLIQLYPARIDGVYELRGRGRLRPEKLTATTTPLLDGDLIVAYTSVDLMQRKKMINPGTITDDMLENAIARAKQFLDNALNHDWRARTVGKYTHDNFFKSYHRGQKWYVSHDPWDSAF